MKADILNSKQKKELLKVIEEQWGCRPKFLEESVFLLSSKENLYLVNRDIERIDMQRLRVDSVGLYIGEYKTNSLRLSIEGSQLIGPHAKTNIFELDKAMLEKWLKGFDIAIEQENTGFLIMKYKNDFVGCGKIKNGSLLNFVPKIRRIKDLNI